MLNKLRIIFEKILPFEPRVINEWLKIKYIFQFFAKKSRKIKWIIQTNTFIVLISYFLLNVERTRGAGCIKTGKIKHLGKIIITKIKLRRRRARGRRRRVIRWSQVGENLITWKNSATIHGGLWTMRQQEVYWEKNGTI